MQLRQDTLFWTREVYESVARQKGHKGSGGPDSPTRPAKSKGRQPSWSPAQPQWNKQKGSPKGGKTKGAMGSGKGKDSEWPSNWAKISPKGVQYCRDHFLKKKCPGNCGRSDNCPVLKNGSPRPQNTTQSNVPTVDSWWTRVASCTEAPPRLTEESTPTNTHATTETGGASSTLPKRHNHTTVTTRGRGPNTRHNLGNGWTDPAWALSMAFIGPPQAVGTPYMDHTTYGWSPG